MLLWLLLACGAPPEDTADAPYTLLLPGAVTLGPIDDAITGMPLLLTLGVLDAAEQPVVGHPVTVTGGDNIELISGGEAPSLSVEETFETDTNGIVRLEVWACAVPGEAALTVSAPGAETRVGPVVECLR